MNKKNTIETRKNKLIISKTVKSEIFSKLKEYNQSMPTKDMLKEQFAIYFFHYVAKHVRRIDYDEPKNKDEEFGFTRLYSIILKRKHYKYNKYIEFLVDNEFVEKRGKPSAKDRRSTAYSINPKYVLSDYEVLEITDKKVINTLVKDYQDKKIIADKKCPHLTQYLNTDLSIDYNNALTLVKNEYYSTIINSNNEYEKKKALRKYESRMFSIYCLKEGQVYYSREGKDNRLHSIITNMAKNLRQFLLHKGKPIIFIDMRTSQPFFLTYLIYLLKKFSITEDNTSNTNSYNNNKNTSKHNTSNITTNNHYSPYMLQKLEKYMSELQVMDALSEDFKEFLYLVIDEDQDLYQSFGETLKNAQRIKYNPTRVEPLLKLQNGNYKVCTNVKGNSPIYKDFATERKLSKFLIFRYLFTTNPNDNAMGFHEFELRFPYIAKFLKSYQRFVKDNDDQHKIPHLSVLLQNMESELILDIVTKEINKLYGKTYLLLQKDSSISASIFLN